MKKLETKNILIHEKNYKDLTIYFTRYNYKKSTRMLYYNELMGKIKVYKGKKYLIVNDCMLNKVLHKVKKK